MQAHQIPHIVGESLCFGGRGSISLRQGEEKYFIQCWNTRPSTEAFLKVVLQKEYDMRSRRILVKGGVELLHVRPQRCESSNSQYA